MKFRYLILLFIICTCSTNPTYTSSDNAIKNFNNYQKQSLPKGGFIKRKENIPEKIPKIAVLALDGNNKNAIKADLGNSIANDVENILIKNQLYLLIDL